MSDPIQRAELQRVRASLRLAILQFLRGRLRFGGHFHADELRNAVRQSVPAAPASPDRILRALRTEGTVKYLVTDRSRSAYRVTYVVDGAKQLALL